MILVDLFDEEREKENRHGKNRKTPKLVEIKRENLN